MTVTISSPVGCSVIVKVVVGLGHREGGDVATGQKAGYVYHSPLKPEISH